jgi:hypothetical protein
MASLGVCRLAPAMAEQPVVFRNSGMRPHNTRQQPASGRGFAAATVGESSSPSHTGSSSFRLFGRDTFLCPLEDLVGCGTLGVRSQ